MRANLNGFDLAPLMRSTIGFDRMSRMLDSALKLDETAPSYPPYNIEKRASHNGDDTYRLTMAVAGFKESDLNITAQENTLLVSGSQSKDEDAGEFLHRGIAARNFERRFQLADHIKVAGAHLENGLLHIALVREVPEAAKPRIVTISTANGTTEQSQAAVNSTAKQVN